MNIRVSFENAAIFYWTLYKKRPTHMQRRQYAQFNLSNVYGAHPVLDPSNQHEQKDVWSSYGCATKWGSLSCHCWLIAGWTRNHMSGKMKSEACPCRQQQSNQQTRPEKAHAHWRRGAQPALAHGTTSTAVIRLSQQTHHLHLAVPGCQAQEAVSPAVVKRSTLAVCKQQQLRYLQAPSFWCIVQSLHGMHVIQGASPCAFLLFMSSPAVSDNRADR